MLLLPLYTHPALVAAAVIPAIFLLVQVYRSDEREKEPARLLLSLVLCGIAATWLALPAERMGGRALAGLWPKGSGAYNAAMCFGVVGLAEEGAKYLLLKWRTWRSAAFNYRFDGVVYAVFVSLGFALWENIAYVARYGLAVAAARAVTAVPGHACFGVFMGVWYAAAKQFAARGRGGLAAVCRACAVAVPVALHGAYDFLAMIKKPGFGWVFAAFVAVMFAVGLRQVKRAAKTDAQIGTAQDTD